MVRKKRRVVEIIEFKVKPGTQEEDVKKASDKAQKFYEKQPGYEHRVILNDKNKWYDQIQWRNVDYAKNAQKLAKDAEECVNLFSIISTKSISRIYPELVKMY